jgi:lipopolysaccharide exporter
MLVRNLRFRWMSLSRASSELTYTSVSLALAALGTGGMAVAWGNLARSALRFATIVPAVGWREWLKPHRVRASTMARVLGYEANVTMGSVASFLMRRWDNLLVSRYYGPGIMGEYNYAYNLPDTPAVAIGEQVVDVLGASFPHAGEDRRPAALVRAWTMLSLVMLPVAAGLGGVSPAVVATFFDARWQGVGTTMAILAVIAAARPMTELVRSYLYACGKPRVVARLEWAGLGALVLLLSTIGRQGARWACASVAAAFVVRMLASLLAVRHLGGPPISAFLRPIAGPALACASMVFAIALADPVIRPLPAGVRLFAEVVLGAAVYLAGATLLFRAPARELVGMVRAVLAWR